MDVDLPAGWTTHMVASGLLALNLPPLAGLWAARRWKVSSKVLLVGALTFTASQLFTRLPLVAAIGAIVEPAIQDQPALAWAWLVVLAASAGLFEETGRLLAFRWLLAGQPRSRSVAVVFGLGHGGLEAMVLVGLSQLLNGLLVSTVLSQLDPSALPPEAMEKLAAQIRLLESQTAWTPYLALWERAAAMTVHVALTIIVVSGFRVGRPWRRWALAVFLHGATNLVAVGYLRWVGNTEPMTLVTSEVVVSAAAALGVWVALEVWRRSGPEAAGGDP